MKDVQNYYIFFDTASLQDAGEQLRNPEFFREILGFEIFFRFPLKQKGKFLNDNWRNFYNTDCKTVINNL